MYLTLQILLFSRFSFIHYSVRARLCPERLQNVHPGPKQRPRNLVELSSETSDAEELEDTHDEESEAR